MISKSCKYAIKAVIFVASKVNFDKKLSVKEIAKAIGTPEAYTAKTLQTLNKHKIITSLKGPYGGFYVEPGQLQLPIIAIVNAIDGLSVFRECGMGLNSCSETHPCPMHNKYSKVRNELLRVYNQTTIAELSKGIRQGIFHIV